LDSVTTMPSNLLGEPVKLQRSPELNGGSLKLSRLPAGV
jgi:hypothetical protein